MAQYLDKAGLTTLWTKIKYTFALKSHTHKKSEITDLTIPTVNNPTITINQGGVKKGSFSLNQSGAATIDLTDDNTTYSTATQSSDGLMSASDKKKLEGIAEGANKITVDSSLSSTSTNPVQNKVINSALNGKSNLDHNHDSVYQAKGDYATNDALKNYVTGNTFIDYTTYIEGEVNKKANASHDHDISDINGLQSALDGKSNTGHGHTISNITNLQSTIDGIYTDMGLQDEAIAGKSDIGHTHKKSDITDLSIPTVNNPTITINQGGTKKGSFSLNQSGATTIDLTDNNTTYTAGAGLDLSNGVFSVKTGYTTNGKNYKVTTDNSGNLYVNVPWNNDTWRPVVDNLTTTDATKSLSANQGKVLKDLVDGKLNNYGSDTSRPGGTSFTFPGGSNPVQMRSGNKNAGRDIGIFSLTDDNAFICNSSDNGYAFAVFDTDKTADFSTASNAAFAVLSDHAGVSIKGGLSVDGKAVSLDGHTHSYLPLSGGTINANNSKAPLILKGGASNWNEGLRIIPTNNWATILLAGTDADENTGTSAKSWSIHNYDGSFYISKNGSDYASTKLSNTDGTWRVNDNTIIHSGNIGSQNVNYATSAGDADTVDGNHASAFAKIASHNNLMSSGDEFTFASSGFSGAAWINYRTAGGTNGNITEYKLGNGAGGLLGTIIHSGNIGSQNVNYANSAGSVAWGNVTGKPSTYTPSAHDHTSLKSNTDNRNSNTTPNDYNGILNIAGLKGNDKIGLDTNIYGTYSCLIGVRGWSDSSGGNAHELAFTGNGHIAHRHGSTTSWGSWNRIAHVSDIPTKLPASNISMSSDGTTLTITYS